MHLHPARKEDNRVFQKLPTIQDGQYCQLHFSCAIIKELLICGETKLAIMPILPILCICKKLE